MTALLWLLAAIALACAGFVTGAAYEGCRRGGSLDLATQLAHSEHELDQATRHKGETT